MKTLQASRGERALLKWVGSKQRLLPALHARLPPDRKWSRHIEPFCGSAALFFSLTPMRAVLADQNPRLIQTLQSVRNDVEEVIACLADFQREHCKALYYETREHINLGKLQGAMAAAAFLYLNRTCYNGLYRENKQGHFNVPMGDYTDPAILDAEALRAASRALQPTILIAQHFLDTMSLVSPSDFVYLDPPYWPINATSQFTNYQKSGFSKLDQENLRDAYAALDDLGCRVLLSNSDTPATRKLYARWHIDTVEVHRSVSCKARGKVREIVVRNYEVSVCPSLSSAASCPPPTGASSSSSRSKCSSDRPTIAKSSSSSTTAKKPSRTSRWGGRTSSTR